MQLHNIPASKNAPKATKRRGRGTATGQGCTSGRGNKGQRSRSGKSGGTRPGFEGGQMPLYRRLPKRGFNNTRFRTTCSIINVGQLNGFAEGDVVNQSLLAEKGVIPARAEGLKVLGSGDLKVRLTVEAKSFSKSAREKIEQLNGVCKVVD